MRIAIRNRQNNKIPLALKKIKSAVRKIIKSCATKRSVEISICFVNNQQIKKLNHKYLKKSYPTDVICFDISNNRDQLLGDIFISVPMAKENASLYGTSLSKELSLYVIHGILHLLGYSDISGRQRKIMHKKQEQLLKYF